MNTDKARDFRQEAQATHSFPRMEAYRDQTKAFAITPQFEATGSFDRTTGLAPVRVGAKGTGKWGFIDRTGKFVINPQFGNAKRFEEDTGLASVRVGDKKTGRWGFIDKTGKFVINPQFEGDDDVLGWFE